MIRVKLPPFAKPSYVLVDVDVKKKDSIKRRRKESVDKLPLSQVDQSFTELSFCWTFSAFNVRSSWLNEKNDYSILAQ